MELLVDENSPLAKTNLRALVLDPEVWKLLTSEQVSHIQKYWPGDSYNGDLAALASNDHLRHDIAQYQTALSEGQHDAEWIRQAKAANKLRNDRFEADKTEEAEVGEEASGKQALEDVTDSCENENQVNGNEDDNKDQAMGDK